MMRVHRMLKWRLLYSPLLPLVGLPRKEDYYTARALQVWTDHNVTEVEALFHEGQLKTYEQMVEWYDLPQGQFLTQRQLLDSGRQCWDLRDGEPPTHPVLHTILRMGAGRHLVTWHYKAIGELTNVSLDRLRHSWEDEVGRALHDKEWSLASEYPKKVYRNTRFKSYSLIS